MRAFPVAGLLLIPILSGGCLSISIGPKSQPSELEISGLADGYATVGAFPEYDGTIFKAGIFSGSNRDGEWASVDLWPLGGVGVGFVGARVRVLFLEVAGGVLGFPDERPKPKEKKKDAKKKGETTMEPKQADGGEKKPE